MSILVWIIAIAIIVLAISFCIFLLLYGKTKENPIIKYITIPIIVTLICAFIACCLGLRFGNPVIAINDFLTTMGIIETPTPTTEPTPAPTPTPTPIVYVEPTFEKRSSEKFNYTIDYPSNFVLEGSPEQDTEDDFNFSSEDRKATLNLIARYVGNKLPDLFTIDTFRNTYRGTELYRDDQLEDDGWYVVSTKTTDGYFHYRKCIFTDGIVRMYTFSFPTDQEDIYLTNYDYVTHIENSFRKLH